MVQNSIYAKTFTEFIDNPKAETILFCTTLPEPEVLCQPIREPKEWIANELLWMDKIADITS